MLSYLNYTAFRIVSTLFLFFYFEAWAERRKKRPIGANYHHVMYCIKHFCLKIKKILSVRRCKSHFPNQVKFMCSLNFSFCFFFYVMCNFSWHMIYRIDFGQIIICRNNNLKLSPKLWFDDKITLMKRLQNILFCTKTT